MSHWLPKHDGVPVFQEHFVAVEDTVVRGAYIVRVQDFAFDGQIVRVGHYHLPISEGVVDRRYGLIGLQMLRDALARYPWLFSVGMGGYDEPVAQLEKHLKWQMVSCPFYFKVRHPRRFLRELTFLRQTRAHRAALDALAFSGLGWLGLHSVQRLRRRSTTLAATTWEEVRCFGEWADCIWAQAKNEYAMIGVRDARVLNTLYPQTDGRFTRLKIRNGADDLGWIVLLDTQMRDHKHFGGMRVASIVDCLAIPGGEDRVVAAATAYVERTSADIIVTNQLARSWCQAMTAAGFLRGPSNFIFSVCPAVVARLQPFERSVERIHMTRGDGDGPIHL